MGVETTVIVAMAAVFGFYMAWNIGANDVANAMGTSVGSKALTLVKAIIIAGVFEFAGAFLAGSHVTNTVRKGIVDISLFSEMDNGARILMYGMLAAPLGAGVWLQLATYFGRPVSTTHSIVGAIVGFAIAAGGAYAVEWSKIWMIVISWVASPLMSGSIAAATFLAIQHLMINVPDPVKGTKRWAPLFVFLVLAILTLVTLFKGLKNLHLDMSFGSALLYASIIGFVGAGVGGVLLRRIRAPEAAGGGPVRMAMMADDLRSMVRHARRLRAKATEEATEHVDSLGGESGRSDASGAGERSDHQHTPGLPVCREGVRLPPDSERLLRRLRTRSQRRRQCHWTDRRRSFAGGRRHGGVVREGARAGVGAVAGRRWHRRGSLHVGMAHHKGHRREEYRTQAPYRRRTRSLAASWALVLLGVLLAWTQRCSATSSSRGSWSYPWLPGSRRRSSLLSSGCSRRSGGSVAAARDDGSGGARHLCRQIGS